MLGVPDKLVVMEVIAVASAVIVTASQSSVLIVGVAELLIEVTRGVIRLLVSVCVSLVPTIVPLGAVTVLRTPLVSLAIPELLARCISLPVVDLKSATSESTLVDVSDETSPTPPVVAIVTVSVPAFVVIAMFVPAARLTVSLGASATTSL